MKVHLCRPLWEYMAMCGQKNTYTKLTPDPKLVTCVRCKQLYEKNLDWYNKKMGNTNERGS